MCVLLAGATELYHFAGRVARIRNVSRPPRLRFGQLRRKSMILVTGASGNVGKAVLQEVAKSRAKHRTLYRSALEATKAPPGTETVIADFAKKDTLAAALRNVDSTYLVCSPIPELVELESNMVDACVAAGVKHVVLNSAMGAGDYDKSFPSWHRKVEDKLKST